MSELKALVDQYVHDHGSSQSWVAGQIGMSRSALNAWWTVGRKTAPRSDQLRALARAIRTPYKYVLDAALNDYGYLPLVEAGDPGAEQRSTPAMNEGSTDPDLSELERKRREMQRKATTRATAARGKGDRPKKGGSTKPPSPLSGFDPDEGGDA